MLPFNVFNVLSHPKKYSANPEKITGKDPINNKFTSIVLYFKNFKYGCKKIKHKKNGNQFNKLIRFNLKFHSSKLFNLKKIEKNVLNKSNIKLKVRNLLVGFLKLVFILKFIKEKNIDINIKIVPKNGAEARKNIPRLKKIKPYLKNIFSSFNFVQGLFHFLLL